MEMCNNLFDKTCCFENLYLAYMKARKCKRYRKEILEFGYNIEKNLLKMQEELSTQIYKSGSYREFIISDSKKRQIKAAPFRDRVVHHAVCNIIEPIFDKGFIYDSYACRKNKGTHKTIKRLEQFLKSLTTLDERDSVPVLFCLQCDISRYFKSIDHKILIKIIKKKIKDKKTLWLINEIINSNYDNKIYKNLFDFRVTGIPIGNLTSQLFANIYLNELDQFMKHNLRIKYYIRYMDDFLIFDHSKKKLHIIKKQMQEFLFRKLELKFHPKKVNIFPAHKGIDFLGYVVFENYCLLRKTSVKRFIKRTKIYQKRMKKRKMTQEKFNNSLQSWKTYTEFANSYKIIKDLQNKLKIDFLQTMTMNQI